jgi:hypothetical protein
MKKILLLLLVAGASTVATAQIKVSGDVFGGVGMNHTSHSMVKFGANLYTTFANHTFIGLGANLGINGKYTYERNVVNNGTYSVVFGKTNVVSDHFAVQPYIGVGFQTSVQTDYQYDDVFNAAAELAAGGVSQLTGGDVIEGRLRLRQEVMVCISEQQQQTITIPLVLRFHRKRLPILLTKITR